MVTEDTFLQSIMGAQEQVDIDSCKNYHVIVSLEYTWTQKDAPNARPPGQVDSITGPVQEQWVIHTTQQGQCVISMGMTAVSIPVKVQTQETPGKNDLK